MLQWPRKCGEVFSELPILTGFGTCFILNPSYSIRCSWQYDVLYSTVQNSTVQYDVLSS